MLLLPLLACTGEPDPDEFEPPVRLPRVQVENPARGLFSSAGDSVMVSGTVTQGSAPIERVLLNGEEIPVEADGRFAAALDPTPGINVIGVRVEDTGGERAVAGLSFHYAGERRSGTVVPDAVFMKIGPTLLDDDQADLDDVASIIELLVDDPSLTGSVIGMTVEEEDYDLEVTDFAFDGADVDLVPRDGALEIGASLYDIELYFDVYGKGAYSWLSTSGVATATECLITAELVPVGATSLELQNASASLSGFALEIDWVPGFIESWITDWARETIEEQLATQMESMAGDVIDGYLDSFAFEQSVGDADVSLTLASVDVSTDGLLLTLDGAAEGFEPDAANAGSLRTDDSPPAWPLSNDPFAVAIDDDFLDQVLFALWTTGALTLEFGAVEMAVLTGEPLPPPLGPVETLVLDFRLPPVIVPGDEEHGIALQLGEFVMDIEREDGVEIIASINVVAGGELDLVDGELAVSLDDRPKYVDVEVGMLASPDGLDPGDLSSLFRLMTPTLLGSAADFMPAFPIPAIPLSTFGSAPELQGKALVASDAQVEMLESGWLVVSGTMVVADE
ncbi:MAG: hypothetical protein GY913_35315 [Proteobacteria bacterium]|nr:hypothetical protein [Pseudomonadota bacterium]MCP4922201.1 hypothetical protein [Pseudomonadota bacterium]